jgi:hypothetical protein
MLSRNAQEMAAEIAGHDWSDAPYRLDRAGHDRNSDTKRTDNALSSDETDHVRWNVVMVTAQVLLLQDPHMDIVEYAMACGLPRRLTHRSNGKPNGGLTMGLRLT